MLAALTKQKFNDPIRLTSHHREHGKKYHNEACEKGWEGVIAKDGKSTYRHSLSRYRLKFKCVNEQELVVGGYSETEGERQGFGALLLGYYENGDFRYAGRVGAGFDDEEFKDLKKK